MAIGPAERLILVPILGIAACGFLACVDPADRRPGTWLSGDPVAGPVSDWSFTDEHPEIFIQVSTPYLIPHSVTVVCATLNGGLIVGARDPDTKRWPSDIENDSEVRLKIGDRIFEQRLELVEEVETTGARRPRPPVAWAALERVSRARLVAHEAASRAAAGRIVPPV
jgi:hypothetical protein